MPWFATLTSSVANSNIKAIISTYPVLSLHDYKNTNLC